MEIRLDGKVAIVTGAAGGIGEAYARGLAESGASVAIADLNAAGAKQVAEKLSADGHAAIAVTVDVGSQESTKAMAQTTIERFGGIDILVNNAALMAEIHQAPLYQYPLDWWERVLRVNLTGVLLCSQAVVPSMIERGGGKIINQSSGGAFTGGGVYGVSKLGVVSLTANLATELGAHNINVNAIAPGAVETEAGFRAAPPDSPWRQQLKQQVPLRASAPPEDLLGALLLLASSAGDWITGQTLSVDGGWIMRL